MSRYHKIVFATDFSPASEKAAVRAHELAVAQGVELGVVHVAPYAHPAYAASQLPQGASVRDTIIDAANKKLDEWLTGLNIEVIHRWVKFGSPTEELVQLPRREGIDLLVIGTAGTGAIHALMGSTALGVLMKAPCDVLVTTPA